MSRNGPVALAFHTLFVIFMVAPILVVVWVAFTPEGYLSFPTDRWSLRWFYAIARYPEFVSAFWQSLILGTISSAIAVAISVPAALAIARYRFKGREAFAALFMSPLKQSEKPNAHQITVVQPIETKLCIMMASTFFRPTRPP